MNTALIARTASAVALSLFAALSAQAADAGQQTYQRVVLGDTTIAAPQVAQPAQQVVPGSHALYLIRNGMDSQQALAIARAHGEVPTVQAAPVVAANELSSHQRYQQLMGIAG